MGAPVTQTAQTAPQMPHHRRATDDSLAARCGVVIKDVVLKKSFSLKIFECSCPLAAASSSYDRTATVMVRLVLSIGAGESRQQGKLRRGQSQVEDTLPHMHAGDALRQLTMHISTNDLPRHVMIRLSRYE